MDVEGFRDAMRAAGIEEVVSAALALYVDEAPKLFASLEAGVGSGDADAVRMAAHTLKSSSANVRAEALAELMERLEACGRDGDLAGSAELLAEASAEFAVVMDYLASLD